MEIPEIPDTQDSELLPHDFDAERGLIASILQDPDSLGAALGHTPVRPEDFCDLRCGLVFRAILECSSQGREVSLLTVSDWLSDNGLLDKAGGRAAIVVMSTGVSMRGQAAECAAIVRKYATLRAILSVADKLRADVYNPEGRTVSQILDDAGRAVLELDAPGPGAQSGPVNFIAIAAEMCEAIHEGKLTPSGMGGGVMTGFPAVDNLMSGLLPGTLNLLAARPGMGKTSFAMNVASNVAGHPDTKAPVLVFSMEMPARQIVMRLFSSWGRLSLTELSEGRIQPHQWADINQHIQTMVMHESDGSMVPKLFIDDSGELTPFTVRSRAARLAARYGGISMIVVDYVQLMRSGRKAENRNLEVGEISRALKIVARDFSCPVLALCQLNRNVESRKDHRPMNSDLRDSGSLEQDADTIIFLHREAMCGGADDGTATLIVGKNRNGKTGELGLRFYGAFSTFTDADAPDSYGSGVYFPEEVR